MTRDALAAATQLIEYNRQRIAHLSHHRDKADPATQRLLHGLEQLVQQMERDRKEVAAQAFQQKTTG